MNYDWLNMDTPQIMSDQEIANIVRGLTLYKNHLTLDEPCSGVRLQLYEIYGNEEPIYENWSLIGTLLKGINQDSVRKFQLKKKSDDLPQDLIFIQPFGYPRDNQSTFGDMYISTIKWLRTSYYGKNFFAFSKILETNLIEIGQAAIEKYEGIELPRYYLY